MSLKVKGWLALVAASIGLIVLARASSYFEQPGPLPDFEMTLQTGRTARFSDFRGKWLIVLFGFTHCQDDCPREVSELARVLHQLGPDGKDVQVLFISVDPHRDTPPVLARFLARFDSHFAGAQIFEPELASVTAEFGETLGAMSRKPGHRGYDVEHSVGFALVDPGGHLDEMLGEPLSRADLESAIQAGHP